MLRMMAWLVAKTAAEAVGSHMENSMLWHGAKLAVEAEHDAADEVPVQ